MTPIARCVAGPTGQSSVEVEGDGLSVTIFVDRGMDIGPVAYRGQALAWQAAQFRTTIALGLGQWDWESVWPGGLMTTCGLRNVGLPSEGHGLHGMYSYLPAQNVRVSCEGSVVTVLGTVEDCGIDGAHLRLDRRIEIDVTQAAIRVADLTSNVGRSPEAVPILYHVNIGGALASSDLEVVVDAASPEPRGPEYGAYVDRVQRPFAGRPFGEVVVEHPLAEATVGVASVRDRRTGLGIDIGFDRATLPRLHQWVEFTTTNRVVALEPANCSLLGRAHDREAGRLPGLEPGKSRQTTVAIKVIDEAASHCD